MIIQFIIFFEVYIHAIDIKY